MTYHDDNGAQGRNRTTDTVIFSHANSPSKIRQKQLTAAGNSRLLAEGHAIFRSTIRRLYPTAIRHNRRAAARSRNASPHICALSLRRSSMRRARPSPGLRRYVTPSTPGLLLGSGRRAAKIGRSNIASPITGNNVRHGLALPCGQSHGSAGASVRNCARPSPAAVIRFSTPSRT